MCKHWAGPKQLPGDHPCVCEISRNGSYQASYGPFPQHGDACVLHSNTLIYSLLKLNTAANTPSDSITLCPRSYANEACTPLIKFQHTTETVRNLPSRMPAVGISIACSHTWSLWGHSRGTVLKRALHISLASIIQTRWWCLEASVARCHVFPGWSHHLARFIAFC